MYNLLINLLSRQSIPLIFRICINLVQFTRSNDLCHSMKQIHSSSSISKVRSAIILSIPIASPSYFSSSKSTLIFSKYILNFPFNPTSKYLCYYLCCLHHHQANMDLGHLLNRSARTLPAALGLIYVQSKLEWKQQKINYN